MFAVAAAAGAAGLATIATVASVSAGAPAAHRAAQAARVVAASSAVPAQAARQAAGQPARQAAGQPAQPHPSGGAHLTVNLARKTSGHRAVARQPVVHQAPAAPPAPPAPYRMYDSVIPSAIPAHQAAAVYSDGPYFATPSQIQNLGHALWIDTVGTNYAASVLDVEPGDATPPEAASWAFHRLQANPHGLARIYTMISEWPDVQSAVHGLPGWMQARVRWWIADPTGVPHIVPGADATQWYWGSTYDLSLVKPGF